jgi:hypothetical protein
MIYYIISKMHVIVIHFLYAVLRKSLLMRMLLKFCLQLPPSSLQPQSAAFLTAVDAGCIFSVCWNISW